MKTYDTTILSRIPAESTLGLSQASQVTGINISELSRMCKAGRIKTVHIMGRKKPELVAGDLQEVVRLKNQRAQLAKIRQIKKAEPNVTVTRSRVVVGVFEDAISRKPDFILVPESADTIGDLISIGRAYARIEKANAELQQVTAWLQFLENL